MQQPTNPLRATYDKLGLESQGVTFERFSERMKDPNVRKATYDKLGLESNGISYEKFESTLEKKNGEPKISGQDFANGVETSGTQPPISPTGNFDLSTGIGSSITTGDNLGFGLGASLTAPVSPGLSSAPWVGATEQNLSDKLNSQIAVWEQTHPGDVAPAALFNQINQQKQEDLAKGGTRAGFVYNNILTGIGGLANTAVDLALQAKAIADTGPLSDIQLTDYRANQADNVRNSLVNAIGSDMSEAATQRFQGELLTSAIGGLGYSLPAMIGNKMRMARFFMQGYDSALQSLEEADQNGDLSNLEKTIYSAVVGQVTANLERVGFDRIFKSSTPRLASFIANKTIKDAKKAGAKIGGDAILRSLKNNMASITNRYARGGVKAVEGFVTEGLTGAAQESVAIGSEAALNELKGKDIFEQNPDSWNRFTDNIQRVGESGLLEAIGGSILGSVAGITSSDRRKKLYEKVKTIENIESQINNPEVSDDSKADLIRTKIQSIKDIEAEYQLNYDEFQKLTDEKKQQLGALNEEAESKEQLIADPAVSEDIKQQAQERLDAIDEEIDEVSGNKEPNMEDMSEEDQKEYAEKNARWQELVAKEREVFDDPDATEAQKASIRIERNNLLDEMREITSRTTTAEPATSRASETVSETSQETAVEPAQATQTTPEIQVPTETQTSPVEAESQTNETPIFSSEYEAAQYISERSNDPDEIVQAYLNQNPIEPDYIEKGVMDYLGNSRINAEDIATFSDMNQFDPKLRRRWVDSENSGISLDSAAEELSQQLETEVTPEEIIDTVLKHRSMKGFNDSLRNDLKLSLAERYEKVTGEKLTDKKAAEIYRKTILPSINEQAVAKANSRLEEIGVTYNDIRNYEEFIESSRGDTEGNIRQSENDQGPSERVSAENTGIQTATGSVNSQGQPVTEPSQSVQVKDTDNPQRAAEVLQGSYDRLTEGMTPEQIEADPELVRMRERVSRLSDPSTEETSPAETQATEAEKSPEPEDVLEDDLKTKIYDRPDMEYPVHRLVVGGKERFIQRSEDMSQRPYWREVVKDGKHWADVEGRTVADLMDSIGDNKKEAIDSLVSKYTKQQKGETQDAIQIGKTAQVPLAETPGSGQEMDQGVREQTTTQEEGKGEPQKEVAQEAENKATNGAKNKSEVKTPKKKTKPSDAPKSSDRTFREKLNTREGRGEVVSDLTSKVIESESPNMRDVTDLAIARIANGDVSSSQQLASSLGIPNSKEVQAAFKDAREFIDNDPDLAATTGRNADSAKRRKEYGFGERGEVISMTNAEQMAEAKRMIDDGYPVHDLIDRATQGGGVSNLETGILVHYMGSLEDSLIRQDREIEKYKNSGHNQVNAHIQTRDKIRDDLYRVITALETAGTTNARALSIRKALIDRDFSLASMISEYRKATQSDVIPAGAMEDIQKRYDEISKLMDDIRKRNIELENENARLEAEAEIIKQKHQIELDRRKAKKKNKSEAIQDIQERRKEALADIKKAWDEMNIIGFAFDPKQQREQNNSLAKAVRNLINTYIEELVEKAVPVRANEVIRKIHSDLKEIHPSITREQVMNLIDSSNTDDRPSLSDLQREKRNFNTELRLIKELEKLQKGGSLADRIKRAISPRNIRVDEIRKRLLSLREESIDNTTPEKLAKDRDNLEKKIKDYDRRIKNKDFAPKRKQLILDDSRLKDLRKQLNDRQFDFRVQLKKAELDRRNIFSKYIKDTVVEAFAIPRTLLATGDLSALLRQLVFTVASRPFMTLRTAKKMFQFWWSGNTYEDYFHDFRNSDAFYLARKSGLALTDIVPNIGAAAREEQFMSNVVGNIESKVPLLGSKPINVKIGNRTFKINGLGLHSRAERGFTGAVNKMRIDMFAHGVDMLMNEGKFPDTDIKDYRALATYVNAATGRGPVPDRWLGVMQDVSAAFFAPRLISSRLYLLSGGPLWHAPKAVRKMYLQDLVGFIGLGLTTLAAASLMGADVEDDPTSTDFGMIRVGDRRYDIWGGHTQYVRLIARMLMGHTKSSTGRITELNSDDWNAETYASLLSRFGRSKLSPTASLFWSAADGYNYMGEPFSWGQELKNMAIPLVAQDIYESWTDYNEGAASLLTVGAPAFFGMGVQTWRANEFLSYGVDNDLIQMLDDKKLATRMPLENRIEIYDKETGEEDNPTGEQFKKYLEVWADYIKKDLRENEAEYKKMSDDEADKKFKSLKSKATIYAKEKISGVSQYDLTINNDGKEYQLSPEQLRTRLELNQEYKTRYRHRKATIKRNLERSGLTSDMAEIEAEKEMARDARDYSKWELLKMDKRGKIKLSEKK